MIRLLIIDNNALRVDISKEEKINNRKLKLLLGKGRRMIQQNNAESVIIHLENLSRVDKNILALFNRSLYNSSSFPVTLINSEWE
tara:strand:- start:1190 stop:1444 length:255 start_codon:yes stop_codon:yes gene_type:complete